MLTHLRRSLDPRVSLPSSSTFVYAFAGTGVSQLFFKHQADGSITAERLDPHRAELVRARTAGFHGRPDDTGPVRQRHDEPGRTPAATTRSSPTALPGESGATNLGPRSAVLARQHRRARRLLAPARRRTRPRTSSPPPAAATTPTSRARTPSCRSRWWPRPPASPVGPAGAHRPREPTARSSASSAAATSTSCSSTRRSPSFGERLGADFRSWGEASHRPSSRRCQGASPRRGHRQGRRCGTVHLARVCGADLRPRRRHRPADLVFRGVRSIPGMSRGSLRRRGHRPRRRRGIVLWYPFYRFEL